MADAEGMLGVYLHLARASKLRRQPLVHDKMLILAGVRAEEMGLEPISALCRHRILTHNAHHLVGQWPTLGAALADDQFQSYLKQLRRRFSPEKTEHMLHSLGIEMGRERQAYFSDLEYAASLLDTQPERIAEILANHPASAADTVPAVTTTRPTAPAPDPRRNERRALPILLVLTALLLGLAAAVCAVIYQALSR